MPLFSLSNSFHTALHCVKDVARHYCMYLKVSLFQNDFSVFSILPKSEQKCLPWPSKLGQKFKFSSSFFGRIEGTEKAFRN